MNKRGFAAGRDMTGDWREMILKVGSVVILSTADYDAPLWTNKQHIGSRLAREVQVLYVESLGLRRPRFNGTDLRRIVRRLRRLLVPVSSAGRGGSRPHPRLLKVVSPIIVPLHGRRPIQMLNRMLLRLQLRRKVRALPRPRVLWAYTPLAIDIIDLADFDVILYHCVDDLGSIPGISESLIENLEKRFAPSADVVIATSPALCARLTELNSNTHYLHNVVDVDHFLQATQIGPVPEDLAAIPTPRAMFVGAISDHKIDWELMVEVAARLPNWSFVFVGPTGEEIEQKGSGILSAMPNAYVVGYRPYEDLPNYMRGADVGLIPYRITKHTSSIFPMKVLEYCAAGLPVVSTPLPAITELRDQQIAIGADAQGFVEALSGIADYPAKAPNTNVKCWDDLLNVVVSLIVAVPPVAPRGLAISRG